MFRDILPLKKPLLILINNFGCPLEHLTIRHETGKNYLTPDDQSPKLAENIMPHNLINAS